MILHLPFPDKSLFPNAKLRGGGWGHAIAPKAKAKEDAYYLTKQAMGDWMPQDGTIPLSIVFCQPDKRSRDLDGMLGAVKHALDGIASALGIDDSRFRPILIDAGPVGKPGAVIVAVGVSITTGVPL